MLARRRSRDAPVGPPRRAYGKRNARGPPAEQGERGAAPLAPELGAARTAGAARRLWLLPALSAAPDRAEQLQYRAYRRPAGLQRADLGRGLGHAGRVPVALEHPQRLLLVPAHLLPHR